MCPTGDSLAYVAGSEPIPVPHTSDLTYRKPHQPRPPKPQGLDWDATKATCDLCGQKSSDVLDGACGRCRKATPTPKPDHVTPYADTYTTLDEHDVAARFTAPTRPVDEIPAPDVLDGPELRGWTITRLNGFRISHPYVATSPGCPNNSHPTRDCGCSVFRTITAAIEHVRRQVPSVPVENRQPPAPTVRAKVRQTSPDDVHITLRGPGLAHRQTDIAALLHDLLAALNTQTSGAGVNATDPGPHEPGLGTKAVKDTGRAFVAPDRPAPAPAPTSEDGRPGRGSRAPSSGFTTFQRPTKPRDHRRTRTDKIHLPGREVAQAYRDGATLTELAEHYNCSSPTIARTLDEQGVVRRRKGLNDDHLDLVRQLYLDQELTIVQIADRLGYSAKAVTTFLNRHEIPIRPSAAELSKQGIGHPTKIQPADELAIVERYSTGQPVSVVAEAFDVSRASIYHVLDKHRVPRHGARPPGQDNATGLKDRLRLIDATSREIKQWALDQGLIDHIPRGIPAQRLVDAYAAAHPTEEDRSTTA